jgi:hypothetical protein
MRNKKKFNEFMNKTIEELKDEKRYGTRLPKYLERFLRILRMQDCLLPPAQQGHTERI